MSTATPNKTQVTLLTATTVAAGTPQTSSSWTITSKYGGLVTCRVRNDNGGSGGGTLTVGCTAYVQVSGDNTTYYTLTALTAGTTNYSSSGTNLPNTGDYDFAVFIPEGTGYVRVVFGSNTGASVTASAYAEEYTSQTIA